VEQVDEFLVLLTNTGLIKLRLSLWKKTSW
jgi:hypothetical protein